MAVEVDFVRLASYGTDTASSGKVRLITDVNSNLGQRDVLIVEDIVDTGRTLAFLREHLLARQALSVRICALLDKRERRCTTVPIDYVAFQVDKGFVVGYGLDCNEFGRHFPGIYELVL
jgi:hypoxanthine phosphoribosyltransferase